MKKFAFMFALGFALMFHLGSAQAATNCKDVLKDQRYRCTVNYDDGSPTTLGTLCIQFDDSNPNVGKFAASADSLPFQCTCQATGSLTAPNFNADKSFICGEDTWGDVFIGKALGNKIKNGEYWCNGGGCNQAQVFDCVVDPDC